MDHPVWCDPGECTADREFGFHHSRARVVPAAGNEPCTASVAVLMSTPDGLALFELGVRHDPDISAGLDMSTEPDFHLYSPSQMRRLHTEIGELLGVV